MKHSLGEWVFFCSIIVLIIAIIFFTVLDYSTSTEIRDRKRCYDAGFPDYRYLSRQIYCVKKENGTDIVIPVQDLER